jgi:hypothetical protein
MTTDALRTAVALYTSGTIDDAEAARYLGLSSQRWAAYRRSHGLSAPATESTTEERVRA